MLENACFEASRRRQCSKMLAPKPPDVEKCSKMLAPKPLDVENARTCSLRSRIARKEFHGVERIIEKEFRSPALEDTSLDEASLRAFNARVHTSIFFLIRATVCQTEILRSPGAVKALRICLVRQRSANMESPYREDHNGCPLSNDERAGPRPPFRKVKSSRSAKR